MKILSSFKDFYDYNTIYDSDSSIVYQRTPKYICDPDFETYILHNLGDRREQNLLRKYKRWSQTYSKPMEGSKYYMTFEYHVLGFFPYIYIIPIVVVREKEKTRLFSSKIQDDRIEDVFFGNPLLPFDTGELKEIGDRYGMDFTQYKGSGRNKRPIHRVILRKFTDIEGSFFYLPDYISPEDIIVNSPEELRSQENRELFHNLGSPVFYISHYSSPKHDGYSSGDMKCWNFVLDPDLSEISYISIKPFLGEGIYERIEEFLVERNIKPVPEPSNTVKIEAHGFDKKTSFRKSKEK